MTVMRWSVMSAVGALLGAITPPSTLAGQHAVATLPPAEAINTAATAALLLRPVTVTVSNVPLRQAVDAVATAAGTRLQFRAHLVEQYRTPVTLRVVQAPLGRVLEQVLKGTNLHVVPMPGPSLAILPVDASETRAPTGGTITGTVVDAKTKRPLSGVTITLDGTTIKTVTDERGVFRSPGVAAGEHTVTVRLLGYVRVVRTVTVSDGLDASLSVTLEPSTNVLEQVVVTGTVAPTELKAVPNAITVITAKDIERRGVTRIDQLFRGDVPGLFVANVGAASALDTMATFYARGATRLASGGSFASNAIKTYVDGVELADPNYLSQIDPKSIERIEILTGPQASTIYGSNAINGVMQIFTKRGTSSSPQVTASLLSGWVENNFSKALTPQHDDAVQLNAIDGHTSYNLGSSWNYVGPWTPTKQTARMSGFAGWRAQYRYVTLDGSALLTNIDNRSRGSGVQALIALEQQGVRPLSFSTLGSQQQTQHLDTRTLGGTMKITLFSWWSQEFRVGSDVNGVEAKDLSPRWARPSDTTVAITQSTITRRSVAYLTNLRIPLGPQFRTDLSLGADAWQALSQDGSARNTSLTGEQFIDADMRRLPSHSTGGFVQGQLSAWDAVFLTYGLRAEWNPDYGADRVPDIAPRLGLAYTQELGTLTAKIRLSYGRATRPPLTAQKASRAQTVSDYLDIFGPYDVQRANPNLGPEFQKGVEGGFELYAGSLGSLVVTRYNQTVDDLIRYIPHVDSVRSLIQDPFGQCAFDPTYCGQYAYESIGENLNVGSIRNQGWELQGSVNTGPFTTKGTYSWTKSRVIGVNPTFRSQFDQSNYPELYPGYTFSQLPEHTWALNLTYSRAASTVSFQMNGTGFLARQSDALYYEINQGSRLRIRQRRIGIPAGYQSGGPGYTMSDMSATHQFSAIADGVLQIQNVMNYYRNDVNYSNAVIGRQTKVGLRLRFH